VLLRHGVALIGPGDAGAWTSERDDNEFESGFVRRFASEITAGDAILLRTGLAMIAAVGLVASDYLYLNVFDDVNGWDLQHARRVRWCRLPAPHTFASSAFGANPPRCSRVWSQEVIDFTNRFIKSPPPCALMVSRTEWTGTASELLGALVEQAGERVAKAKTWPDSPRALAGHLRRAATFLRKIGVEMGFEREGRMRTRVIRITAASADPVPERGGVGPSAPSASSAPAPKSSSTNGFVAPDPRTIADDADGRGNEPFETVRANPLKPNGEDGADDADANGPAQSAFGKTGWSARL
jgi:hypothetical protein